MGQRIVRVSELLKREISHQLHTNYRGESVYITIVGVDAAPDLRTARVYYSVVGDAVKEREAGKLLSKIKNDLRSKVGKHVVLKYLPKFEFILDHSIREGSAMIDRMSQIEEEDNFSS